ncbi:MAG: hypothetical protein ACYS21_17910, partial [Planctomycetota bacterium]
MKSESVLVLAVMVLLVGLRGSVWAQKYSGGTGEPNDPYRIAEANDMNDIGNHVEDFNKCFVMVKDINLAEYTGTQFNIIGPFFSGVFDGNGHAISNFTYDGEGAGVGLFSDLFFFFEEPFTSWPLIKDLTLIEPNVNAPSGDVAGGLVGCLGNFGIVRDCKVQGGSISGGSNCSAGGLIGLNVGIIRRCSSTAAVSGGGHVGGLVGSSCEFDVGLGVVLISDSYSAGSVFGPAIAIGGLVGCNADPIENSYSCAQVAEGPNAGGLVGYGHESVPYVECFWDSEVSPDVNGIGNRTEPNVIGKTTAEMMTE